MLKHYRTFIYSRDMMGGVMVRLPGPIGSYPYYTAPYPDGDWSWVGTVGVGIKPLIDQYLDRFSAIEQATMMYRNRAALLAYDVMFGVQSIRDTFRIIEREYASVVDLYWRIVLCPKDRSPLSVAEVNSVDMLDHWLWRN